MWSGWRSRDNFFSGRCPGADGRRGGGGGGDGGDDGRTVVAVEAMAVAVAAVAAAEPSPGHCNDPLGSRDRRGNEP